MNELHYLSEEHLLIFLVQLFVLIGGAKLMGSLFRRWGYPELAGEILVGIILGATVLGRMAPALYEALFPRELIQHNMLETMSWLGVLFLLLATGFEVSLSSVWKQGKAVLSIGVVGVIVPLVLGSLVFWWFPSEFWGPNANRLTFTLFLATAASISALSVIAKILHDLEVLKTDLGLTTLSAFVVNDLLGWMVFTLVLGLAAEDQAGLGSTIRVFVEMLLFGTVCLTVGSKFIGAVARALKRTSLPHPATTLSLIACLAILCGAITQWIGIHAILGFFLAGVMAGNTTEISERTREILSQMVHSIFVPLFFATIGIRIDFVSNFDLLLVGVFTAIAMGGKFIGAWLGALLARMSRADAFSTGIAFIPGGAMEIVIGMLALELGLIPENVFVAVVFATLSSSVLVGPMFAWSLKRRKPVGVANFLLPRRSVIPELKGTTRWDVIPELCASAAEAMENGNPEEIISAVRSREEVMGTALEKGVAVPHARLSRIKSPVIAFGRSQAGIDWDARDGRATHFVFLVLTPEREEGAQVQILAAIARLMVQPEIQDQLMTADSPEELHRKLRAALSSSSQHGRERL
ncbi:MAG: cation:proton antiporter [Verrucomicrobia bacterium]|nr:cation:proton antiporter [Verrucomicrobiota bacterium]